MLARSYRLQREKDIRTVVRSGQAVHTPHVRLHFLRTARPHSRIACVVGTRVSRSAVVRHRVQRQLRAMAHRLQKMGVLRHTYDMVWYALPGLLTAQSAHEVEQALQLALAREQL